MNLELRLRDALVLEDTGADFIARVMARVDNPKVIDIRARRRSRFVGLGTLAVVGIAAAMFAWQMSGSEPTPEQTGLPQPVLAEGLDVDKEVAVTESPSPTDPGTAEPSAASAAAPQVDASRRFTILVMPPADESADPGAKPATTAFHSALLLELRRMPDLVLVDSATVSVTDSAKAEFRLTVGSGGMTAGSGIDGGKSTLPMSRLGIDYWPVEARIEEGRPAPEGRDFVIKLYVGIDGAPGNRTGCGTGNSGRGSLQRVSGLEPGMELCMSTARIAAALADVIRQQAADPAVIRQQLVTQLRNGSLQGSQRASAMSGLLQSARRDGSALDAASISAIADYISGLAPARRKSEWLKLRNLKNPEFVQPMLGALRQDTDEAVRLAVLDTLVVTHGGEQPVLDAIDALSRDDPREIVRMAARRVLHGETEWRSYVKSTLRNASLPFADRLQPLLVTSGTATTASQFSALQDTLRDDEVAGLVVRLVRERMSDASQLETSRKALALLGNIDHPEVLDLQLEALRIPFEPGGFPGDQLAVQALSGLMRHRDEPRVRKVLDQIMAGELNPVLRSRVESQLMRMGGAPK